MKPGGGAIHEMNTATGLSRSLPAKPSGVFWPSFVAALIVLATAAAGIVFRLGPMWHYITDGVTAFAVLSVAWEVQRRGQHTAARTAAQIEEVLKMLRSVKADLSSAELKTIEAELQRLQLDVLSRTTLRH